ncbi:MAG: hypothetical protein UD961_03040 [Bacteroidales bacterium]|nr:hypothetical protein [Bacteroidales bacterium]
MKNFRTYMALWLMVIFCTYYAGISMFSHTHIANGSSIVHSHLGGDADHDHSDSQYAVIDILSHFQSESAVGCLGVPSPFFQLSESYIACDVPICLNAEQAVHTLRGPPMA